MRFLDQLYKNIDAFPLTLAMGPLALYFLVLGFVHIRSRPLLVSGGRDATALACALSGLVALGPMELFMPQAAIDQFGSIVWVQLVILYALGMTLIVLLMRPRIVVYNVTMDQLRPALASAVKQLQDEGRWAGESLCLPNLGVQLYLDTAGFRRQVQLIASCPRQNHEGWKRLARALKQELRKVSMPRTTSGAFYFGVALALVVIVGLAIVHDPQQVVQGLQDKLRW